MRKPQRAEDVKVPIRAAMGWDEILDLVSLELDDESLFVMIASIDEAVEDWSFTEKCFNHFKSLMDAKKAEDEEEAKEWVRSRSRS